MTQPWPAPPAPVRSRNWLTATLAAVAVVLAAAALIVALTRSGSGSTPTYTAAQKAEAKTKLCDSYRLVRKAVQIETHANDNVALARLSETNGGVILRYSSENPALDPKLRDAANALAAALLDEAALGSNGKDDPQFLASVDKTNAKDRDMQELCGD
ncbi:MAG: hypothetical protein WBH51_03940 [Mycolicibacter algericus]|uniref:hypothetical protein n=1 Tax=Mycolicibacter algericus TaxID=1288388 RepID=UPI003C78E75F